MKIFCLVLLLFFSSFAQSEDWVTINDMSKVRWQMAPDGRVFFRNLNDFNGDALSCCYNYYIDTTTAFGKSAWSVILAKMATSDRLVLGVKNIKEAGPVTYLGEW